MFIFKKTNNFFSINVVNFIYLELLGDLEAELLPGLFRHGVFFLAGVGVSVTCSSCVSFFSLSSVAFSDSDFSLDSSLGSVTKGSVVDESTCSLSSSSDKLLEFFSESLIAVESDTARSSFSHFESSSPDSDLSFLF